ncbi:hypothetical protein LTS17_010514 [Exophiala oligosperma]
MECPGVSCWDFAYAAGPCPLSSSTASLTSTTTPREHTVTANKRNSTARRAHNTPSPCPSSPKDTSSCRPDSPRSFLLSYRHNKQKSSSLKHDNAATTSTTVLESRTYLLSCPTSRSVTYPHTYTTISTLLSQPRNQIILLVPQNNIVCPRVCELSRLPRSGGSCLQILPIPEVVGMAYGEEAAVCSPPESGCESDSGGGGGGVGDVLTDKEWSDVNVAEVVRKITKYTKARSFDGYLVFEDDRAKWQFLERVGKGVKEACKKKEKAKMR